MSALFPFYPHDLFGEQTGMLLGTLLGMLFGFTLERAGFGRARNLAAQFYLTDTRVLKVMFGAIVTTMLGIVLLSGAGLLDVAAVTVPETFLWAHLLGGLLLGIGFIVSGYCPGTGVVAAASGNVDGAVTIGGVMLGSLFFGFVYPGPVERLYKAGAMGVVRIPDLLGVPAALVAFAVVAMAIGAFVGAEKLEAIFAPRAGKAAPASPRAIRARVFAGMGTFAVAALLVAVFVPRHAVLPVAKAPEPIAPLAAAQRLVASPERYWVLDLRSGSVAARLPGAIPLPAGDADASIAATLPPTRTLLVYDQGPVALLPKGVARWSGRVAVLDGGFDAWQRDVLAEPSSSAGTPEQIAELRLKSALRSRFTGATAAPVRVDVKPAAAIAPAPRKGGGC